MKAAWQERLELSIDAHQHIPSAVFAQLATVSPDHRPANRTVVFRSFLHDQLIFTTRSDSEKISHLRHNPCSELCWYFVETREQYRISGTCRVIDASSIDMQERRISIWQSLSDASRQMFTRPAPGKPLEGPEAFTQDVSLLPDTFVLIALAPTSVETLDLRAFPHHRRRHDLLDNQWRHQDINP